MDSNQLSCKTCEVNVVAGDQGIVCGCASDAVMPCTPGHWCYIGDLSSVHSNKLSCNICGEVLLRINKQSPDIGGAVHVGKEDINVCAGDPGIMFGCASDDVMPVMRPRTASDETCIGRIFTISSTFLASSQLCFGLGRYAFFVYSTHLVGFLNVLN